MAEMIAYLDNSATTRPSEAVIDAMSESMRGGYFNPSSLYAPAMKAEQAMNRCREAIMESLKVTSGQVIFTSGGTESNNLAIIGSVTAMHKKPRVIASAVEHPSVLNAFEYLKSLGYDASLFPVDEKGQPVWDALEEMLDENVGLVSCMQVNNETGATPDLKRLGALIRKKSPGALFHVDGVQGFLRSAFDANIADMYTLSGHKLNGPKGIGALWTRQGVRLTPIAKGGGQEGGLRSGTENTPGIAGLLAAVSHMDASNLRGVKNRLVEGLKRAVPGLIINGPAPDDAAPHVVNASFPGVRGEVMLHALEGEGVFVSTGSACSSKKRKLSPVLLAMGVKPDVAECAVRFSLCPETTPDEVDYAVEAVSRQYDILKRFHRR